MALYRVQRSILLRQAEEKQEELKKIERERGQMREKLATLEKLLVQRLRTKPAQINNKASVASQQDGGEDLAPVHNGHDDHDGDDGNHDSEEEQQNVSSRIMAVLSEVKESDLMTQQSPCYGDAFHPCVCCVGKLLTV